METKNEISAIRSKGEDRWGANELRGFGIGRGHCKQMRATQGKWHMSSRGEEGLVSSMAQHDAGMDDNGMFSPSLSSMILAIERERERVPLERNKHV